MATPHGDYRARMRDHKGRSRPISIFSNFGNAVKEEKPTNYVLLKDYLTKAPEKVGRWRRRWFELHKQGPRYVVHYWEDSNKKVKKGCFDVITGSVLYLPQTEKALRGFVFQINVPKPNKRTYMLAADTEAQFMRWIMAMESAVRQDMHPPEGLQPQYLNTPETRRSNKIQGQAPREEEPQRTLKATEEAPKAPAARPTTEEDIRPRTFTNMVQKGENPSRPSLNPKLRTTVSAAAAAAVQAGEEDVEPVADAAAVEAIKAKVSEEDERNFLASAALTEELMLADEKLLDKEKQPEPAASTEAAAAQDSQSTSTKAEEEPSAEDPKPVPGKDEPEAEAEEDKEADSEDTTEASGTTDAVTEEPKESEPTPESSKIEENQPASLAVPDDPPKISEDEATARTLTEDPPAITVTLEPVEKWGINFAGTIDVLHSDMDEPLRIYLPGVRTYDPAGISGDVHSSERVGPSCEKTLTYLVTAQLAILKTKCPARAKDNLLAAIQKDFQPLIRLYHGRLKLYDWVYRQIQAAFFFKRVPELPTFLIDEFKAGAFNLDCAEREHSRKYFKSLDAEKPRPPTEFYQKLLQKEDIDDIVKTPEAKAALQEMAENEDVVHENVVPAYFSVPDEVLEALKSTKVLPKVENLYEYDEKSGLFRFAFTETGVAYQEEVETSYTVTAKASLISLEDLPPFPSVGVSIDLLKEFISGCDKDWTTTVVCTEKIIPVTSDKKCSYAELMLAENVDNPHFGKPTHFVSHAWRYNFHNLVDALESYAEDYAASNPETTLYFWVDLFVVNQHIAPGYPQEWWSTTFKQAIADIGETVLVMEPWDDPVPLTRAWCLWEILCTVASNTKLSIRMAREQHADFHLAMLERFGDVLTSLSKVDGARAEAFNEADKDMIFQAVEKTVGFLALNGVVKEEIRYWLAESAAKALAAAEAKLPETLTEETVIVPNPDYKEDAEIPEGEPVPSKTIIEKNVNYVMRLKNGLANLNVMLGQPDVAETMLKELVAFASPFLGSKHPVTVKFANDLATVVLKTGKMQEAEDLHRFVYEADVENNGPKHHDSLTSLSNLITFLGRAGKLEEAAKLSLECIAGFRELCGDESDETLKAINNYAVILEYLEKWPEATEALNEAHAGYVKLLGPKHPLTLTLVNNLGSAYFNVGDIAKADQHYRAAINGLTETLGAGHPDTMEAVYNLGMMLFNLHQPDLIPESEKLLMQAYTTREKVLGKTHPTTLNSLASLGGLYRRCGMLADAEECYAIALEGSIKELGPQHSKTLQYMTSLASVLEDLGQLEEAEQMLRTVLPLIQQQFAPHHSSVITCQSNLGCLLYKRRQFEESEQLLRIVADRDMLLLGSNNRKTCGSLTSLATVLREIEGKLEESINLYQLVLKERKELLKITDPVYAQSIQNLTDVYLIAERNEEVRALHKEYVDDLAEELDPKHPSVLVAEGFYGGVVFETVALKLKRGEVPTGDIKETVEEALQITCNAVEALMKIETNPPKGLWLLTENLLMMSEVLAKDPPSYVAELEARAAAISKAEEPGDNDAIEAISDGEDPEGLKLGFPDGEDAPDAEA